MWISDIYFYYTKEFSSVFMKKYYASRASLFLIELIISIFFFIVSAAIVLQLFVTSHFASKDTININNALYHSQNISEIFLGNNGSFSVLKDEYKKLNTTINNSENQELILLLFNKEWTPVTDIASSKYIILAKHRIQKANSYNNYSCLDIYINKYTQKVYDAIYNKNYDNLLNDSSYIHHLSLKKYSPENF